MLQDLHQCLGVVVTGLLQADPVGQPVGHHAGGVLLDAFVRHGDQGALPYGLTCRPRQAESTITHRAWPVKDGFGCWGVGEEVGGGLSGGAAYCKGR